MSRSKRKPTSKPRRHWYNPALGADLPERTASSQRGRARQRVERRRADRRLPRLDWTWIVIGFAIVGVLGTAATLIISAGNGAPSRTAIALSTPAQGSSVRSTAPASEATARPISMADLEGLNLKAWDGKRRLTVLLMGLDKRPGERGTGFRTDTLIILSLDPATQRIGMLSLPRDLRVPIPNRPETFYPINAAYVLGELERPGYGARLTAETIQYNLGIPIDHYVVLSFEAVIGFIDAIGGITIDVPSEIVDNEYPDMAFGYDPLYIPAGRQVMDGALALKYARTRHQTDDFDRTRRQQQVILAVRQQVLRSDVLPRLILQAPSLWNDLSKGIITDLTLDQILSLAWYLKDFPLQSIQTGTLDERYIRAVNVRGETLLTIDRERVAELMISVFGANYNR
ncbi:MAG: LCP family protein [Anaerolineae bacterium]|nr:LCP family protein [Anaerolineae bacterium]MDW8299737.1 LCP family protein [Anaerolineae bacterium]